MMGRWREVRSHVWRDERGTPVLMHVKKITPDGEVIFPWKHWLDFGNGTRPRWYKGKGGDDGIVAPLLYPLDVFARADRSAHVYICEGEKDCDALSGVGVLAVTAGGVCEFNPKHARLFKSWRGRITIVRDNDAPGAFGAARTYGLLRDVGIPAARLRVARGRCAGEGSDAFDHLEAGWSVDDLIPESIAHVRKIADTATAEDFKRAGYDRAPRYAGDPGWVVVGREDAAELTGWKPRHAS
ncbi:toprim domain-containing protein [Nocardioides sp. QY071]|uniref:toprim domain-containing protein n=1 Tax=Nocardioides sp. QY071 TaxID=3044187 RepID=UPI00249AB52A|nr:toprim domain-containing protein [Nocardioides sp. QY071]WGY04010.1 toprim domain-containing protein [Nocardioides sp. QY071]